jgi:endogenous inhibitor of DNA gyrase (YacG/DUF329 family)
VTCPICGKRAAADARPFCSGRCADIDLGKWMRGDYAVPSGDADDIERALDEAETEDAKSR